MTAYGIEVRQLQLAIGQIGSRDSFELQRVDFCLEPEQCMVLLGPSGCGKTTLLKLIAGLLEPDAGEIRCFGTDVTHVPAEQRQFAFVFQQPLLFPHMNVLENVQFPLRMQKVKKSEQVERAREMLRRVEMDGLEKRLPRALSGGQQQRVALARALVAKPRLLLLDEPFSALDSALREEMRQLVKTLHHQDRFTMLFVTHDRDEAFYMGDQLGVMHTGKLLQVGRPHAVHERPKSIEVAKVLGIRNLIAGYALAGRFYSGDWSVPLSDSTTTHVAERMSGRLMLRNVMLQSMKADKQTAVDGTITIDGHIVDIRYRQGWCELLLKTKWATFELSEKIDSSHLPKIGEQVTLGFRPDQTYFIPEEATDA